MWGNRVIFGGKSIYNRETVSRQEHRISEYRKRYDPTIVLASVIRSGGICNSPHLTSKCGTRPFLGGTGRRAVAHTRPAFSKNAYGPVGIPLIRGDSGARRLTQPPAIVGKSLGGSNSSHQATPGQIRAASARPTEMRLGNWMPFHVRWKSSSPSSLPCYIWQMDSLIVWKRWVIPNSFLVLNPCLPVFSFHSLCVVCLFFWFSYFCTTREMPTQPGVRRNNGVRTTRRSTNQSNPAYGLFHCLIFGSEVGGPVVSQNLSIII